MRETIFVAASLALILLSGCGNSSTLETELSPEVLTEAQAIAPDKVYDLPKLFFAGSALVYGDRRKGRWSGNCCTTATVRRKC